jgi:hypothetical protein
MTSDRGLTPLADQSIDGDPRTVSADGARDCARTLRHIWLQRLLQERRQRSNGECAGLVRGSDTKIANASGPVVLVVELRHDHLR